MIISDEQLKQIKEIELELFDEFLRICNKYNLRYFLSGGSCLGAIRHQGFIPWDDDIDVSMPRKDFDFFSKIMKDELDDRYVFQSLITEPNCGLVFGKIRKKGTVYSESYSQHINMSQGVWIDIFPYDNIPDQVDKQKRFYNQVQLLKNLYIIKCGYSFPEGKKTTELPQYLAGKALMSPIPLYVLANRLYKKMHEYQDQETTYVIPFGGAYGFSKEKIPSYFLCEYIDVIFEGRTCKTLSNYDRYLSQLYGNYMELPPIEQRKAGVHNICEFRVLDEGLKSN